MKNIGFLFGAGAEISYGMPSGGKFALDIFRQPSEPSKQILRNMRDNVDKGSSYASNWLPEDYDKKNISSYGKHVFDTIIRDTIGNNRDKIINKINNFDKLAEKAAENISFQSSETGVESLDALIESDLGRKMTEVNVNQKLAYNDLFEKGNGLFSNRYFATLIYYYSTFENLEKEQRNLLGELITSIFQLQLGALSETLSRGLEDSIF